MTNSKSLTNNSKSNELFAIAETSGQQFWFEVNRYYDIDRLNAKEKDKITLEKVLLIKECVPKKRQEERWGTDKNLQELW